MTLMAGEEFVRAKDALIRAAYRGLLRREPDAAAAAELRTHPFTDPEEESLAATLAGFVNSHEFQRTASEHTRPDFPPSTWARIEIEDLKLWIDIGDRGVSRHCASGTYEPAETAFIKKHLAAGMTFVDIGANIGWFTVNAAKIVGNIGRVISFEPRKDTFNALQKSIEDNNFSSFCHIHNNAVGDAPGELLIGWNPEMGNPGGTWLLSEKALQESFLNSGAATQTTNVVTLDSIIGNAAVDVIKIDIEGAEPMALQGAMGILTKQRPIILCEINPSLLRTVSSTNEDDFVRSVENFGYQCRLLTSAGEPGASFWNRKDLPEYDMINVVFFPV